MKLGIPGAKFKPAVQGQGVYSDSVRHGDQSPEPSVLLVR